MDIYRYINSKDIRAHLQNIGYRFSTLEAVRLILTDTGIPMRQRFADLL
jgi:hypothetical protein